MNLTKRAFDKFMALFIVFAVLFTSFAEFIPKVSAAPADEGAALNVGAENAKRYFGDQLGKNSNAKAIYEAFEKMRDDEIFMSGDTDCPVSGILDTEDKDKLLQDFARARDAFKMDNPDLFYVDFDKLTISVNTEGSVYVGIGRDKTYLLRGFTKENIPEEIKKYEEKISAIVARAKVAGAGDTSDDVDADAAANTKEDLIKINETAYVHDYIIENMVYKYEDKCTTKSELCNHRTAYDALINQEGVCEAYGRSFKAVLDRLDIPAICIYGLYKAKESFSEEHLWNYVKIGDAWYGVDITHDDPVSKQMPDEKVSQLENRDYFMVSATDLNVHHLPVGDMSGINYDPFTYPDISLDSQQSNKTVYNNDGKLKVKINKAYYTEKGETGDDVIESGDIYVSYDGHSIGYNEEHGNYIVCKLSQYYPGTDEWSEMNWAYITPQFYGMIYETEEANDPELGKGYSKLPLPHIAKAQFAVTHKPPDLSAESIFYKGGLYYQGDPLLLESVTEEIDNPWGNYVAPPYPKTCSPKLTGSIPNDGSSTTHIKIVYDDQLIPIAGEAFDIDILADSYYSRTENDALSYCKLTDKKVNGDTLEFDFKPSDQFNHDLMAYTFTLRGYKGQKSGKRPKPVTYVYSFRSNVGCSRVRAEGGQYVAYGQPSLIANEDVSKNLKYSESKTGNCDEPIDEKISHRLTLVAQETNQVKKEEMQDLLEAKGVEGDHPKVESCSTYDIQLNLCKKQILKTGDKVKVCVGFPQGYSKDDAGVTFIAYHYIVDDKTGEITGVEEIPCEITPQGLVMWVDSFSPFMIAAVDTDSVSHHQNNKTVSFNLTDGGQVLHDGKDVSNESIKLTEDPLKITVKPITGYKIDKIDINGHTVDVKEDGGEQTITIKSDDTTIFPANSNVNSAQVNVSFITDDAKEREDDRPEQKDIEKFQNLDIQITQSEDGKTLEAVVEGDSDVVTMQASSDNYTYQWYKDDQKIDDATEDTYELPEDSTRKGNYKVVVSKADDSSTALTKSTSKDVSQPDGVYAVTFDPNGGSFADSVETNQYYTENSKLTAEDIEKVSGSNISRLGYEFKGWSKDEKGTTAEDLSSQTFNGDTTLYAVWEVKAEVHKVKLDLNGAKLSVTEDDLSSAVQDPEKTVQEINSKVTAFKVTNNTLYDSLGNTYKNSPKASRTGLTFTGWKVDGSETPITDLKTVNTDITVTPAFGVYDEDAIKVKEYLLELNPDGGVFSTESESEYTLIENGKLTLPIPTKENYIFAGWWTNGDNPERFGDTITSDSEFIAKYYPDADPKPLVLTAHWIPNETLNFEVEVKDPDSDKVSTSITPGKITVTVKGADGKDKEIDEGGLTEGDKVTYTAHPAPKFTFKEWQANGQKVTSEDNKVKAVALKTDSEDTTDDSDEIPTLVRDYDPTEEITALFESERPLDEIEPDTGTTSPAPGTPDTPGTTPSNPGTDDKNPNKPDSSTKPVEEYTISFVDNTYHNNFSPVKTVNQKVPKLPTVNRADFTGWYDSDGNAVTEGKTISGNITLYARYSSQTETEKIKIGVSASPTDGGKVTGGGDYNKGDQVTLTATASEGYKFDSWTEGSTTVSDKATVTLTAKADTNYVAHFSKVDVESTQPQADFTLDKDTVSLSSAAGGTNEAEIKVTGKIPAAITWQSSNPAVVMITESDDTHAKIKAAGEGTATVLARSGDVQKQVKVDVSNRKYVMETLKTVSDKPDELSIDIAGIKANPALNEKGGEIGSLSVFAWSQPDQSDMNAQIVYKNPDGDYKVTLPINGNEDGRFFVNSNNVNVHVYANTAGGSEFMGSSVYREADNDFGDHTVSATPYAGDLGFITPSVYEEATVGTTGQSRQLEGIRLITPVDGVDLIYSVHMADKGWGPAVSSGTYAGTMHENRQLEAVQINLTGANADKYDLQYRAHVADKGWLSWVGSGQIAGTTGEARRLEAIEVRLVAK